MLGLQSKWCPTGQQEHTPACASVLLCARRGHPQSAYLSFCTLAVLFCFSNYRGKNPTSDKLKRKILSLQTERVELCSVCEANGAPQGNKSKLLRAPLYCYAHAAGTRNPHTFLFAPLRCFFVFRITGARTRRATRRGNKLYLGKRSEWSFARFAKQMVPHRATRANSCVRLCIAMRTPRAPVIRKPFFLHPCSAILNCIQVYRYTILLLKK